MFSENYFSPLVSELLRRIGSAVATTRPLEGVSGDAGKTSSRPEFTMSGCEVLSGGCALRIVSKLWITCFIVPLLIAGCSGGSKTTATNTTTNQAPTASIASPLVSVLYKGGDTLNFSGSGVDPEDGTLAPANLTWWVDLHHDNTHTHPVQLPTPGNSGSITMPTRMETSSNVFLRFHLRATDSESLTNEVTRDIQPQKAQITLTSQPASH